jgi:hypothetical protein
MKNDSINKGHKEKKESTLLGYNLSKAQISKQERERKRERIRVNYILTDTYYSNNKEINNEKN